MRTTALAAAAAMAMSAGAAVANTHDDAPKFDGTVLVLSAEAEIAQAPDMATVSAGVLSEGKTAEAALSDNSVKMSGVFRALRAAGIAERDIQTSNLNLSPQYQYNQNEPPRLIGYQASNNVSVRVRNLTNLGRTLDAVVANGANQLQGVSFSIDKADEARDAARREAMRKARARADLYAQAAGLRVTRIVSINEGGAAPPPMMPVPMMARSMAADAAPPPPVAGGEVSLNSSVTVVFELK